MTDLLRRTQNQAVPRVTPNNLYLSIVSLFKRFLCNGGACQDVRLQVSDPDIARSFFHKDARIFGHELLIALITLRVSCS